MIRATASIGWGEGRRSANPEVVQRGVSPIRAPRAGARDGLLQRTARLEVRVERALARALSVSNDNRLYQQIGFVRLSDYVRETLGISVRSAQEMMRTEKSLAELPWTSFWWEMGTLHKEHVRVLSRVATPLTERWWILQAQRLSVRDLAARVRAQGKPAVGDWPGDTACLPAVPPLQDCNGGRCAPDVFQARVHPVERRATWE